MASTRHAGEAARRVAVAVVIDLPRERHLQHLQATPLGIAELVGDPDIAQTVDREAAAGEAGLEGLRLWSRRPPGNLVTWSARMLVTQMFAFWSTATAKGSRSLQGLARGSNRDCGREFRPLRRRRWGNGRPESSSCRSPRCRRAGVAMTPCILLILPPKLYPSGGESGLPEWSKTETVVLPPKLLAHRLSWASIARPNPGPSSPPPLKPETAGESGLPSGANSESPPLQKASWFCAPT